jgi:hypothetical protein
MEVDTMILGTDLLLLVLMDMITMDILLLDKVQVLGGLRMTPMRMGLLLRIIVVLHRIEHVVVFYCYFHLSVCCMKFKARIAAIFH